jgi:hypothetical protein
MVMEPDREGLRENELLFVGDMLSVTVGEPLGDTELLKLGDLDPELEKELVLLLELDSVGVTVELPEKEGV